jgi:hypothetical protein
MEGRALDNLTKVVMGVLKKHGGVFYVNVVKNLMSFRVDGVNVFYRVHKGVICQMRRCKL